jgi:GT2 family glycosyltransferase
MMQKIIPLYSKRWFLVRLIYAFLSHPLRFISKISTKRIDLLFSVLKKEGIFGVLKRLNNNMAEIQIPEYTQNIQVFESDSTKKEITDYESILFKKENTPLVSIIIPVYNQFSYTYNCLKSILHHSGDKVSYEIIIANDCSNDITTEIHQTVSNINVVTTPANLGFLKNCNNAAKEIRGKYILFLNNDTQVQENWLSPLVELIEEDEQIGAVGSKMVFPNGMLLEAVGVIWNDGSAWNYGRMGNPAAPEFNYVKEVDYLSGAALMVKKSIWEKLGGFDELYAPAYYEDPDLCFSIRKMGYRVMYQPASSVAHFEGITNGTDITEGQKKYQVINQKKFYEKWKSVLEMEHFNNGDHVFLARDRSKNKKTILVVDEYVPRFDKDAASRTVFQYLKLFVGLGYNVKFIGDDYHKNEPYTTILGQMGIEVLYGNYYARNWKAWLKTNGQYIHFVFLSRPYIAVKYIDAIGKFTNAKVFYYGQDLHFLREQREYEIKKEKSILRSANSWKKMELELMKKMDINYYPSQVEVDEIKKEDTTINVKAIPAYLYDILPKKERDFVNTKDIMFIGGFMHQPNVDGILWYIKEIYPIIKENRPDIKTYILGSNVPEEIMKFNSENIVVIGYVTDEQLGEYYRNCRLAIVPLRYGAGIKGKVVEALYNQIPVVTTSIGAEGIKGAENCMFIKNDPVDFAEEIVKVYDDYELMSKISIKETEIINESFTMDAALKIISEDFNIK